MKSDLKKRLDELHAELESLENVDGETREHLRQLSAELQPFVEEGGEEAEPDSPAAELVERWNTSLHRFESEHPTLARAVARISHVLSQMGL